MTLQVTDEAAETVAREQWMRVRVRDAGEKGRGTGLAPWDHLSPETQQQKLHEARQDLEAALPHLEGEGEAELQLGRLREALGNGEPAARYLTDYDRQMFAAFITSREGEGALRELLSWVEQSAEDEDKLAETDGEGLQVEAAEAARVFRDVAARIRSLLPEEEK